MTMYIPAWVIVVVVMVVVVVFVVTVLALFAAIDNVRGKLEELQSSVDGLTEEEEDDSDRA